jgi:hypothetical protein
VAAPAGQPLAELLEEVRPLAQQLAVDLVRQELARLASLNGTEVHLGAAEAPPPAMNGTTATPDASASTKACRRCERVLPASAFETGRRVCRACRRAHERERATASRRAADGDDPEGRP